MYPIDWNIKTVFIDLYNNKIVLEDKPMLYLA